MKWISCFTVVSLSVVYAQNTDSIADSVSQNLAPVTIGINRSSVNDAWISQDKFLHFSASAALAGLTYYACLNKLDKDERSGAVISISLTGLVGLAKELYDKKNKRHFSWKDLLWDAAGLTIGYFLFMH